MTPKQKKAKEKFDAVRVEAARLEAERAKAQFRDMESAMPVPLQPFHDETVHSQRTERRRFFSPEQIRAMLIGKAMEGAPENCEASIVMDERGACVTVVHCSERTNP